MKSILQLSEFRYLLGASLTNALAMTGFNTVIGYQLYTLTKDPLSLGWLGLVEAVPSLSLALLGGHLADRFERRRIVFIMTLVIGCCLATMTYMAATHQDARLLVIYGIIFCIGLATGFLRPASSALEQQVIPTEHISEDIEQRLAGGWHHRRTACWLFDRPDRHPRYLRLDHCPAVYFYLLLKWHWTKARATCNRG